MKDLMSSKDEGWRYYQLTEWCGVSRRVDHPVLDQSWRLVECHGVEGVGQRLLVLARTDPGVPAW
jgi:hypothetical protein